MESCGRYIVLVMTFEVATHFLKCISCSITPQTPNSPTQRPQADYSTTTPTRSRIPSGEYGGTFWH